MAADVTVEVMLAHPCGIVEVYVGDLAPTASGFKIELADNITVRTSTARQVERSQRLYGLVEGDLAYVVEMAAEGHDMTPQLSAKLSRIEAEVDRSPVPDERTPGHFLCRLSESLAEGRSDKAAPGGSGVCLVLPRRARAHTAGDPRDGV